MKDLICDWLRNKEEQMTLLEEDGEVTLIYQESVLLLAAQLTSTRADGVALQYWARLGAASLVHFQGALAQNPDTGVLWLTQSLKGKLSEPHVLDSLAALLNQRDAWRAIFARLWRPPLSVKPLPLRSQLC
ncbi:type III secretion protein [Pseudomonas sp. NIBRBAC000502773]|uniref:type III secretion protein n=1 Tax=Pseudomonas sp. NIBRBAC000502773 TaxID=2590776 RepID=UPI001131A452|nr:type III secretion protein [Pseudomonas sp. NIBRBAC000502773]QDG58559.1 type III secretion protein [Pseudomonas sp. NIBRBAC000502773]